MSGALRLYQRWGAIKPPVSALLDAGHPHVQGLIEAWMFRAGGGYTESGAVGRLAGTITNPTNSTSGWRTGADGPVWNIGPLTSGDTSYLAVNPIPVPALCSYEVIWVQSSAANNTGICGTTDGTITNGTTDRTLTTDGSNQLVAYIFDGAVKTATGPVLASGLRYHAIMTIDGANLTLYLNGHQVAQTAAGGAFTGYSTPHFYVGVGTTSGANAQGLGGGQIIAAAMWRRGLRPTEVAARYRAPYDWFAPPVWRRYSIPTGGVTVQSRTCTMAVTATVTTTQLAVRARTVAATGGGLITIARLALRARTLTTTGGGTVTSAALAIRARTVAAVGGGTVTATRLALRARTLAATAGGTLTATGSGIAAGIQARSATLAITATVTTSRLAVRARTLTAPAGGLLTSIGSAPGHVSQRTAALLVTVTSTMAGAALAALRGITQGRAGQAPTGSQRGGTSSGGKRWTR